MKRVAFEMAIADFFYFNKSEKYCPYYLDTEDKEFYKLGIQYARGLCNG